jgi:hypothetical protein
MAASVPVLPAPETVVLSTPATIRLNGFAI